MRRKLLVAASFGFIGLMLLAILAEGEVSTMRAQAPTPTPVQSYAGKVRAPEFPDGLDWINVSQPLTFEELRGKVVLLDFWTYGCINCIHIIPDLKRLEAEFANELVVIGVHSAKFKNEGNTTNIRYVVQRYGVEHPVVNDKDFAIWQRYGVRAWPTSMLIDPEGRVLGYFSGEGVYDALQPVIKGMIAEFEAKGLMDRTPIKLTPETRAVTLLAFPGKVYADVAGSRLFISDTGHNRVIVADLATYEVKAVIGSGDRANRDGEFATAAFNAPQGLAVNGDTLFVADTGNHTIRAVDLKSGSVTTIGGTGAQNRDFDRTGGKALETAISSPWDVVYLNGTLYIAVAGLHQLWALDLKAGTLAPHAGDGREELVDGPLAAALLAQPSGIATDGKALYFADSESSAIRIADVDRRGEVRTVVGMGLFEFGDIDGVGDEVRLQHALGVTVGPEGKLYVADTYNSKIKIIDPTTRESKTLFGGQGYRDGKTPLFWEPGGLSYADGKLYIADTNNHAIRVVDLAAGEVTTLAFPNPEKLQAAPVAGNLDDKPDPDFYGEVVTVAEVRAAPGDGRIELNVTLPQGYKLNNLTPFRMHVYNDNPVAHVPPPDNDLSVIEPPMPISVPVRLRAGSATLTIDATIIYCEAVNETLCFPANVRFVVPLRVDEGELGSAIQLAYHVTPPTIQNSGIGGK